MKISKKQNLYKAYSVKIEQYEKAVYNSEDRVLFSDAAICAKNGALRAAYIMIWLSCAESLKRKIIAVANSNHAQAQKAVKQIEEKEAKNNSVDRYILEQACNLEIISKISKEKLEHIYEMRCVYGHPYNEEPLPEQILNAAAVAVDAVLAHPTRLKQAYAKESIIKFTTKKEYIPDYKESVENYAINTFLPMLSQEIYGFFLKEYWSKMESDMLNPDYMLFTNRCKWISLCTLDYAIKSNYSIFNVKEWHDIVNRFTDILIEILEDFPSLFKVIGTDAQNSLIVHVSEKAKTRPYALRVLEQIYNDGLLNSKQTEMMFRFIKTCPSRTIYHSRITFELICDRVCSDLASCIYTVTNEAYDYFRDISAENIASLEPRKQELMGIKFVQHSLRTDWGVCHCDEAYNSLHRKSADLPQGFVRGLLLAVFFSPESLDSEPKFDLKIKRLPDVIKIVNGSSGVIQKNELQHLLEEIDKCEDYPCEEYFRAHENLFNELKESYSFFIPIYERFIKTATPM